MQEDFSLTSPEHLAMSRMGANSKNGATQKPDAAPNNNKQMNHFLQSLMNVRGSFQKEGVSDIIQEDESEFDDSRIIQLQPVSSPLAFQAAGNYVSERSAF